MKWMARVIVLGIALASEMAIGQATQSADPVARIRDEGLNHSRVMATLSYLTDVIGPRLTGSPSVRRANEWTREQLAGWGLANAHAEPWGTFGRPWTLKRFSMQVTEPQAIVLIAYPKAWSPGLDQPIEAPVIHIEGKSDAELERWAGKLHGAVVLVGGLRSPKAHFEPLAVRMSEADLLVYANSNGGNVPPARPPEHKPPTTELLVPASQPTTTPASRPAGVSMGKMLTFLKREGASVVVTPSGQGDGGTIFVASASLPGVEMRDRNAPKVWAKDAPSTLPQVVVAVEDFNRMVRMIAQGERLKMAVELKVESPAIEEMGYNTIAEIPGTDLKDQIVMLGGHLDSWHSGTGATDNGVGAAVAMEAVRIIQASGLKPRRTIRVALWTGEEQGLFGSKAYVKEHFGYFPQPTTRPATRPTTRPVRGDLVRGPGYERLSAYFNLDNGTGKARGIFLQGNEALWPVFKRWMKPLNDLGADTVSLASTGSTDHIAFEDIGLPGFQFIQDPVEYMSRTHHSNQDVYDRVQEDDAKQAAIVMATFVWQAAQMDQRLPRKDLAAEPRTSARPTTRPARR